MTRRQLVMLLALAVLWGGSFPAIKAGVEPLGPFVLTDGRLVLGAAALALVVWTSRRAGRWLTRREALAVGALNAAVPFSLIALASTALPASLTSVLNATTPVFGAVVGAVLLGERLTPARAGGLVLGLVGVAICVGLSPVPLDLPTILACAAMLAAAASYALAGHYVRRRLAGVDSARLATGQLLAAAVMVTPLIAADPPEGAPATADLAAVAYLAVPGTAIAYLLYFHLIAEAGATNALTVTFLVPPFGVLFSALLLGEDVGPGLLAGGVVVLLGVALVTEVLGPSARGGRRPEAARTDVEGDAPTASARR